VVFLELEGPRRTKGGGRLSDARELVHSEKSPNPETQKRKNLFPILIALEMIVKLEKERPFKAAMAVVVFEQITGLDQMEHRVLLPAEEGGSIFFRDSLENVKPGTEKVAEKK
jgi:hypothetical protein